jgi:hypothetical protein
MYIKHFEVAREQSKGWSSYTAELQIQQSWLLGPVSCWLTAGQCPGSRKLLERCQEQLCLGALGTQCPRKQSACWTWLCTASWAPAGSFNSPWIHAENLLYVSLILYLYLYLAELPIPLLSQTIKLRSDIGMGHIPNSGNCTMCDFGKICHKCIWYCSMPMFKASEHESINSAFHSGVYKITGMKQAHLGAL